MVSCAYLFVLFSALAVTVIAEDVEKSQSNQVDEKWFGGWGGLGGYRAWNAYGFWNAGYINTYSFLPGYLPWINTGMYGCALFSNPYPLWFSKAVETGNKDKSRRSLPAMVEHINRRDVATVPCANRNGQKQYFQKADCLQAAANLAEKKASSATQGGCTLSLVSPQGLMDARQVPTNVLQKAVEDILMSCAKDQKAPNAKRSPAEVSKTKSNEVVLVLSKRQ